MCTCNHLKVCLYVNSRSTREYSSSELDGTGMSIRIPVNVMNAPWTLWPRSRCKKAFVCLQWHQANFINHSTMVKISLPQITTYHNLYLHVSERLLSAQIDILTVNRLLTLFHLPFMSEQNFVNYCDILHN